MIFSPLVENPFRLPCLFKAIPLVSPVNLKILQVIFLTNREDRRVTVEKNLVEYNDQ